MKWIKFSEIENSIIYCIIDKSQIPKVPSGGLNASLSTINCISSNYTKPFTLMCSGGVDSQAMAYTWKQSNVEHNIVLFEFTNIRGEIFNKHDLETFIDFAKVHNIKYKIKRFNYFNFLKKDLYMYAKKYDCASPQITFMIRLIETIGKGTIILSGNFWPELRTSFMPFTYDTLALDRFSKSVKNFQVIPFFFLHDPELAFGFTYPTINGDIYVKRYKTYQHNGFPVIPQEQKYSGFEKIKDHFDNKKHLISYKDRLRFLNKPSQRIFDIKYRYMIREQIGKEPEFKVIFV